MKIILFTFIITSPLLGFSQINYENLKGNKINSSASFQFSEAYYYDYVMNSFNGIDSIYTKMYNGNFPETLLTQKYNYLLSTNRDEIQNKISVLSKITVEYNQKKYCFIKFKIVQKEEVSKVSVFVLEKQKETWKENTISNKIIQNIKLVLSLKEDAFSQFEIQENNPEYPEINKLKPLVKDTDGVLNIYKLAEVIEKNKTALAKYLDE